MIASLAILSLISGLITVTFFSIQKRTLKSQYNNLVQYIETKAENWANDTKKIKTTVGILVENGYLEADDEQGNIYNPITENPMNCQVIAITYHNGQYEATLTDESICDFEKIEQESSNFKIILKENTPEEKEITKINNWWSKENIKATLILQNDFKGMESYIKSITWSIAGEKTEKNITDFYSQNTYIVEANSLVNNNLLAEIKIQKEEEESIYYSIIRIDKQSPTIYTGEINFESQNEWTNKDKILTAYANDGNSSGISGISISGEKNVN